MSPRPAASRRQVAIASLKPTCCYWLASGHKPHPRLWPDMRSHQTSSCERLRLLVVGLVQPRSRPGSARLGSQACCSSSLPSRRCFKSLCSVNNTRLNCKEADRPTRPARRAHRSRGFPFASWPGQLHRRRSPKLAKLADRANNKASQPASQQKSNHNKRAAMPSAKAAIN